jgi:hypothetical protein
VDAFSLAPLELHDLRGDLSVDGRDLHLENAEASAYGGAVLGSLEADLQQQPSYRVTLAFQRVNLAALTDAAASLRAHFSGAASGEMNITANGTAAGALASSLQCRGSAQIRDAEIRGISLLDSFSAAQLRLGDSAFPLAAALFTCGQGRVNFSELRLTSGSSEIRASGSVDFGRQFSLRLHNTPPLLAGKSPRVAASAGAGDFELTGTLEKPELAPVSISGPP